MTSAWAATALGLSLACASATTQTGASDRPAPPATAPAAAPPAPAATAPSAAQPMTAAEAAEKAHQEWIRSRGGGADAAPDAGQPSDQRKGGSDDAPCASDADCTLTRIAQGGCCATLCSPRAVTKTSAAEIEKRGAECRGCVEPLCRDPGRVDAVCRSGRCVAQPAASRE